MTKAIDDDTKRKIAQAYQVMTAKSVAAEYGISERQVRRIAKEVSSWTDDAADDPGDSDGSDYIDTDSLRDAYINGISPKFIRVQYLCIYEAQMKAAEYYHTMAVDESTKSNCAWGNLELRFLQEAARSLSNIYEMSGSHQLMSYVGKDNTPAELEYQSMERDFKDLERRKELDYMAERVGHTINWDVVDKRIQKLRDEGFSDFDDDCFD